MQVTLSPPLPLQPIPPHTHDKTKHLNPPKYNVLMPTIEQKISIRQSTMQTICMTAVLKSSFHVWKRTLRSPKRRQTHIRPLFVDTSLVAAISAIAANPGTRRIPWPCHLRSVVEVAVFCGGGCRGRHSPWNTSLLR